MKNRYAFILLSGLLIAVCCSGCHFFKEKFARRDPLPIVFQQDPTLEQIVQAINANTQRVNQLESKVNLYVDGMPKLSGNLALERPKKLRVTAGLLGMSEMGIDLGSNDEYFWFWNRASVGNIEPIMLYSSHRDFQTSTAARALPIEPQWVIDSLGLITLDDSSSLQGPFRRNDGRLELRMTLNSPRGPLTKVIVVDPKFSVINQQSIYDSSGKLIAYCNAYKFNYDGENEVRLPRQVDIFFYDEQNKRVKLSIAADSYRVNSFYGDEEKLFGMPQPGDVKMIDISKANFQTPVTNLDRQQTGIQSSNLPTQNGVFR